MSGKYFEDVETGEKWSSPSRTVTEADITNFAGISGDFHPLHTDEEYAKKTVFKGRIAHGLLTLAIASGLKTRVEIFGETFMAFLGIEKLRFTAPVRIGDTIHVETEITDKRETSKEDRGVVTLKSVGKNQRGEQVYEEFVNIMIKRKPKE